jgi:hypothetical protein
MSDLWVYDGGNWVWMSGSSAKGQYGSYGDKEVATGWRDNDGNLWIIGGSGYNGNAASNRSKNGLP